ncbi:MAG: MarR family winged helix-turn-helix transcriptional regulator [Acidobacteriota bacterium]|nr:MarR family winged helix-turn-helix transcriptional regulator [Acidobacteriota bacterium]
MNTENSLIFSFTGITTSFKDNLDKHLKEIGLHGGQAFVLFSLWREDGQSQIALAHKLNLSAPTINKMVKSLSKNGYVDCQKCESDGRLIRVYLTQKGLECRGSVEEQWTKMENVFFSALTETEKLIFQQILEKLKQNLKTTV